MNMRKNQRAFTLIELLVVITIIAILVAILLPSVNMARQMSKAVICGTSLRGIGQGLVMYDCTNQYAVPAYNMHTPGTSSASTGDVIDGWAAILELDGLVPGSKGPTNNIFYCPETLNIDGMDGGQTLYDQDKPQGYQDWPLKFLSSGGDGATKGDPTLPIAGFGDSNGAFMHQIRCGYWLNAYNPIGTAPASGTAVPACTAYTQSVGFGPYTDGNLPLLRTSSISRPCAMIVACDGMYMGRQSVVRLGEQNRRIGYRHPGKPVTVTVNGKQQYFNKTVSNAIFADGHAEPIHNNDFPHSNVPAENMGRYSILANK